jgi:hypothetical protein
MTPIESIYDHRILVLLNTIVDLSEDLAVKVDVDSGLVLTESLLKNTRKILKKGGTAPLENIERFYPVLLESLD